MTNEVKKSLGQHWLTDQKMLDYIVSQAELKPGDCVLEVGPGTGNLTIRLLGTGAKIIAVEKDENLAATLPKEPNLKIQAADILKYDLSGLQRNYKVVANIPYYLTSHLLQKLASAENPPIRMVLLLQKEVAERMAAKPGQLSLLAISVQLYYQCQLGQVVPAEFFEPPPKVDSQVVIMQRHTSPLFPELDEAKFFRVVKAGFSQRRKKLRSALAGGLGVDRVVADQLLHQAEINGNQRAQELSLNDWYLLSQKLPLIAHV